MPNQPGKVRIASILLEAGVVTREQIDDALARQRSTGRRIGETLVEMGAATEEDIGWALARQLRLPFVDPRPETLDRPLLHSFPQGLLQRLEAVPLVDEKTAISVAVSDPLDSDLVRELEQASGRPLTLAVATPSAIRYVLREMLGLSRDTNAPTPAAGDGSPWDRSGPNVLLHHVAGARHAGASEVHFLSRRGSLEVFHRIGTSLVAVGSESAGAIESLRARLQHLGLRVPESGPAHAVGRVTCPLGADSIELGVSLLRAAEGPCLVLDLAVPTSRSPLLEDLGLDALDVASLRGSLEDPVGLGIVTGPPRSGGSTTLRCLFAEAASAKRRTLVLEAGRERSGAKARDWAEIAVGQSVDVLSLDGVLNGETVREALGPGAAGRLLLLRTDWTDTFALLEHLTSGPGDRAALAGRLRFVVQQRLLRREHAVETPSAAWPKTDRLGVFEVLMASDTLREAFRMGGSAAQLRACAEGEGFQPLTLRFQALVDEGVANAADAARCAA